MKTSKRSLAMAQPIRRHAKVKNDQAHSSAATQKVKAFGLGLLGPKSYGWRCVDGSI